jgi:hypothetical protein
MVCRIVLFFGFIMLTAGHSTAPEPSSRIGGALRGPAKGFDGYRPEEKKGIPRSRAIMVHALPAADTRVSPN